MTLAELNGMDRARFTESLGAIFEHSPWVAERAFARRPFPTLGDLHAAMCAAVAASDDDARLALIRAHPQLASKAALRGELSADSQREQNAVGLDQCSPEELARLTELNRDYEARFGFPFIVAVRDHTRQGIIALLEQRLHHTREQEIAEALRQIERIARLRLDALVEH
jgi:2-oxo-4-hydroxy-4-carboxy-5-ureidoimidazoline decarboxylase